MVMRRTLDRLPPTQRDELIETLHAALLALQKAKATVNTQHPIATRADLVIRSMDEMAEVLTGDRRFLHKLPFAGKSR
jgi:hypothetical protein